VAKENQINTPRKERGEKKRHYRCTTKTRNCILVVYKKTGGSISGLAKKTGISRARIYQIFDEHPEVREEIDAIDENMIEERKKKAVSKLDANVEAGLQRAIEYTLEKEPRKQRGKIVVNKENEHGGGNVQVNLIFKEVEQRQPKEKAPL